MPSHPFEAAREATLAALVALAEADQRIQALWLQGSLAAGSADPFSDIDAYLAIRDADYDALWTQREALLERLGGALAWSNTTTPALAALHALMGGGARLDLFFEKASAVDAAPRPAIKVLVSKGGLAERLRARLDGVDAGGGAHHHDDHPHDEARRDLAAARHWARPMADVGEDGARPDQLPDRPADGGEPRRG